MDNLDHLNAAFDLLDKAMDKSTSVLEDLIDAQTLVKKIRDHSYAYDKDGKAEFEFDICELADKISIVISNYSKEK